MEIKCQYKNVKWLSLGFLQSCEITSAGILARNPEIKAFIDEGQSRNLNTDVEAIRFLNTDVHYFPKGLSKIFPKLKGIQIMNCGLKEITREDLIGLENIADLSLFSNELTSLPDDLFEEMKNLKRINIGSNKLEFVSSQLLQPVLQNQLIRVSFEKNPTIDAIFNADPENASDHSISLPELMKLIDENCKKPIEDITFEQFRMDFVNGMKDFWTTGKFSDFTIVGGARNFPVHKNVLAIHSEFFRDIYADKVDTSELKIEDLSAEAVEKVLKWMYSGRMAHDICNAFEIFALVMKLKIPRLKSRAENMVLQTLDQKNMMEVFDLGHRYNSEAFKESSFEEIKKFLNEPDLDKKLIEKPEKLKALVEIKKNYNEMLKNLKEV